MLEARVLTTSVTFTTANAICLQGIDLQLIKESIHE